MIDRLRVGVGVDAHRFSDASPCLLLGLRWPEEARLVGHSDGDAAVHALCDAVLSACQLGDVGNLFGVDRAEMVNASGIMMLKELHEFISKQGFVINNVALQVIGNAPKIMPRRTEAQTVLSEALGAPVSVAATTTDGMGFTGRGEGVLVIATALIQMP